MAFGDECGVAVVDIIQKTCLLSMGTPDLYGNFYFIFFLNTNCIIGFYQPIYSSRLPRSVLKSAKVSQIEDSSEVVHTRSPLSNDAIR